MTDVLDRLRAQQGCLDPVDLAHGLGFSDVGATDMATGVIARRLDLAEYAGMQAAFDDLAGRADVANPFMSPALVAASAAGVDPRKIVVLVAFDSADPHRLLGTWSLLRQRDVWSAGCEVLQVPIRPRYECQASPVLDKQHARRAFAAMLVHAKASHGLPRVIRATSWPTGLAQLLPAGWCALPTESWQRAMMKPSTACDAETYLKLAMGKALNKRNSRSKQLGELGHLATVCKRGGEAVAAFEHYISLEARGWKGKSGTSLAEVPADAAYMRAAVARLAEADRVAIDMITLNDQPIAVGVVIEASGNNLFWKAAFDETHARFAPGSLLHLAVTRRLFAEGRPLLDSCTMEFTSLAFMPWSERAAMARVTITCGSTGMMVRAGARLRQALRIIKHRPTTR
jgi:hypothetical protein